MVPRGGALRNPVPRGTRASPKVPGYGALTRQGQGATGTRAGKSDGSIPCFVDNRPDTGAELSLTVMVPTGSPWGIHHSWLPEFTRFFRASPASML